MIRTAVRVIRWSLALILAVFFAFVGWMKAFAPMPELVAHHAWTARLPEAAGRAVGWTEMAGATCLVLSLASSRLAKWHRGTALYFIGNQIAAGGVHLAAGESQALPQNVVLIAGFAVLAVAARPRPISDNQREKTA